MDIDDTNVLKTTETREIIFSGGSGCRFKDQNGKEYIDLLSQGVCVSTGYNNRTVIEQVQDRLDGWSNTTPYMLNQDQIEASEILSEIMPGSLDYSAFYSNGSDAIETALKLAMRGTNRRKVISYWGSYHGFTGYALAASGALKYRRKFEPMIPGFVHISPPYQSEGIDSEQYFSALKDAFFYENKKSIAAVLIEPIISGGMVIPPDGFLKKIRDLCDEAGAYLIIDEVISGHGRTGEMFAFEHFDVEPDMVATAKGISSSVVPASSLTVNQRVLEDLGIDNNLEQFLNEGHHVVTNHNHPLVCTAAKANMEFIQENNLVNNARNVGDYLLDQLFLMNDKFQSLSNPRGKGLLAGINISASSSEYELDTLVQKLADKAFDNGMILFGTTTHLRDTGVLHFRPALVANNQDIDDAMEIFEKTLDEFID